MLWCILSCEGVSSYSIIWPLSLSNTLLYGYTVAYGISGWSNVSPSEPSISVPSAAVIGLKSAVATPVILVDLRSVKDR